MVDAEKFGETLSDIINKSEGFRCVGAYNKYGDEIRNIEEDVPDILLLDVKMPVKSGIKSLKKFKSANPSLHVIMLAVFKDGEKIFQSLKANSDNYLLKESYTSKILEVLKDVNKGGVPFLGEAARKVLQIFQNDDEQTNYSSLSGREHEVLSALVDGLSTKAISEKLFVSIHTVRFHLHNIYRKLHVNNRTEAVAKAFKHISIQGQESI
jgi:DNA-binding NarL/FixJ family response regulator